MQIEALPVPSRKIIVWSEDSNSALEQFVRPIEESLNVAVVRVQSVHEF
jgi:hypothetical protein